ncbi:virulence factor SrfC family protein [Methylobrevis pamukkalensis]|uniref:Putative bacterial virulence factor n=1 Tax=Methylobrevis pamukkalensis TaxID=1439726 RepID=A0A1E3H314_9HYPH|nr:virulence factor SrfC family protein [Methylobrevis pamukkalensis]ODN70708.1 putative bacterial virulence factor [Methylobrevis pamukkalensis]
MDLTAHDLAAADATLAAIDGAVDWMQRPRNAARLGEQGAAIEREVRRGRVAARRLRESAGRPMAVAVFGPSQAGKSHLISVLARKGDTLLARFDGLPAPLGYIDRINPDKGKEATGLVTRFTLRPAPSPPGFPVHLRLLGHADVIKILANTWFFEGNPGRYETWPERDAILAHVEAFRGIAGPAVRNGLDIDDVWDIEDYLARSVAESELTKRLKSAGFWQAAATIVPRLDIDRLGAFFAPLWGRHAPLTDLYLRLVRGLERLGFCRDAFVPIEAIDVTGTGQQSIIDVEALTRLAMPDADPMKIRSDSGIETELPRPVVTALAAELRIVIDEKPFDFFDHTDLLDFPGYRGRGLPGDADGGEDGPVGLARAFATQPAATIRDMMLRGKVEYLFQRYAAEQEISAMLLCLKESNMDIRQLPEVIARWVEATHGRVAAREGVAPLLYVVLTRFDMHFEAKSSDESLGLGARFHGRLDASLLKPFGSADGWLRNWANGAPFRNTFLMRNPNIRNMAIFDFDGLREQRVKPEQEAWIARLRAAFLATEEVNLHLADPARAFDEMMRLNDGGAGYIARSLAPVCRPTLKSAQIRARLTALRSRLGDLLGHFHVSTDLDERLAERRKVADRVLEDLYACDERHRLGSLIRAFMIDGGRLADHLHQAEFRRPPAEAPAAEELRPVIAAAPMARRPRPGARFRRHGTGPRPRRRQILRPGTRHRRRTDRPHAGPRRDRGLARRPVRPGP